MLMRPTHKDPCHHQWLNMARAQMYVHTWHCQPRRFIIFAQQVSGVASTSSTTVELGDCQPAKRQQRLPSHYCTGKLVLHDKRLQDILPQPPPALPLPSVVDPLQPSTPLLSECQDSHNTSTSADMSGFGARICRVLNSTRNSFGLFRQYYAEAFPLHNPEGETTLSTLSNIIALSDDPPSFGPYPNKSSFWLGEWYWNHGAQKSQKDFKKLVDIIKADDFEPSEIRETSWNKINRQLSCNDWDKEE